MVAAVPRHVGHEFQNREAMDQSSKRGQASRKLRCSMANNPKVQTYFKQVIQDYNCGDIRALLSAKLSQAGPLLTSVVNGIDILGGMTSGFKTGSAARSERFMQEHLGLAEADAKLLYSLVRCGMDHEGTAKLAVRFFVYYEQVMPGRFLFKDDEMCIWLDVTELARCYLSAVDRLAQNPSMLVEFPAASAKEEAMFVAALGSIQTDINEFCTAAGEAEDVAEEAEARRLNLQERSSQSPFLAEHLNAFKTPGGF